MAHTSYHDARSRDLVTDLADLIRCLRFQVLLSKVWLVSLGDSSFVAHPLQTRTRARNRMT